MSLAISSFLDTLSSTSSSESQESFYLSDSGIDDALLRIARNRDFRKDWSLPTSGTSSVSTSGGTAKVVHSSGIIEDKYRDSESEVNLNDEGEITSISYQQKTATKSWYDPAWGYRKDITFTSDVNKIPSTQTNFPVLIKINGDTDIGSKCQADCDDLLFTAADGTTKLAHEIEKCTVSNGALTAWIWVKVPSLFTNTDIYIYYGNASASSQEDINAVWDSNYMMVQHLDETARLAGDYNDHLDSTQNINHLEAYLDPETNMDAIGQINGADDLDGSDDYEAAADSASLSVTGSLTLEAWVKPAAVNAEYTILGKWDETSGTDDRSYRLWLDSSNKLNFSVSTDGAAVVTHTGDTSFVTDSWDGVVAVYNNSGTMDVYVNGVRDATQKSSGVPASIDDNASELYVGAKKNTDGAIDTYFNGVIDEVRVSNIARSEDWIKTSYANQSDPDNFYSIGAEETP